MYEIVVDLETTANGPGNSPEAHYPANKILWTGWQTNSQTYTEKGDCVGLLDDLSCLLKSGDVTLIGHNLKFDLKYLMRYDPGFPWHKLNYHCTMYEDYLASGHERKFTGLEALCSLHNVPYVKSLDLGALIKSGIKMEDIPDSDLEPYLKDDVLSTAKIFRSQKDVIFNGVKPLREAYTGHIPALADIELNGLALDVPEAQAAMKASVLEEEIWETSVWDRVQDCLEWSDGVPLAPKDLNFTAPRTISYLLTGCPSAGLTKRVKRNIVWKPSRGPSLPAYQISSVWGNKKPTHLGYPLSKFEMERIVRIGGDAGALVEALRKFRDQKKLTSTYYGPFLEEAKTQPSVHPKLNISQTSTGRLSSSKPNGQNMPEMARNLFKSTEGQLMEIDFKQLEIVALAYLSGDVTLIKDIQNGEDIHFNSGRGVMGWKTIADMDEKSRKIVKGVNFGLIYGGGAKGIAHSTGQDQKLIKALIKAFYDRYPGVRTWQNNVYTSVVGDMKPNGHRDGEQTYHSYYNDPKSQRKYHFVEGPAPGWVRAKTGRGFSFKPTETKNYPVQGFAGGDIVMRALGELWEIFKGRRCYENTKLRMTVHDSILVDTDLEEADIEDAMARVCLRIKQHYQLPFNLQFDITTGTNWR